MTYKPGTGQTIDAIYAWVATEPDGGEGVCAALIGGMVVPLVNADMDRVRRLRPHVEEARRLSGRPVHLVCYGRREDLECCRERPGAYNLARTPAGAPDSTGTPGEHDGSGRSVRPRRLLDQEDGWILRQAPSSPKYCLADTTRPQLLRAFAGMMRAGAVIDCSFCSWRPF
jgi:hypothetical protein